MGFSILMLDEYRDPTLTTRESYGTTVRSDPTSTCVLEMDIASAGMCLCPSPRASAFLYGVTVFFHRPSSAVPGSHSNMGCAVTSSK